MPANWDTDCQNAIDLAKQTLKEGEPLGVVPLFDALFHATGLKTLQGLEVLEGVIPAPQKVRSDVPSVPPSDALKQVLSPLMGRQLTPRDLFTALLRSDEVLQALRQRGLAESRLQQVQAALQGNPAPPVTGTSAPVAAPTPQGWRDSPARTEAIRNLSAFGKFLTVPPGPKLGRITPLDKQLRHFLLHLATPRTRGVLLVGASGIGKTTLVHCLAQRVLQEPERLPLPLRDLDLFELNPGFPGDSDAAPQQRIRELFKKLGEQPRIFLFIDRVFAFLAAVHGLNLFESFKRHMDDGAITCIGCLAPEELNRLTEIDGSLTRRFRVLHLSPATRDETLNILKLRRSRIEEYFKVKIADEQLVRAVQLADDLLRDRHQPEKSLRLLETACASAIVDEPPATELQDRHLTEAVEEFVGPIILPGPALTVDEVRQRLRERIKGQDEAINGIARAFVSGRSESGWIRRGGPRGVYLFGGPTGVGKTETAIQLARILGGGHEALVRVDCQNLQGSGSGHEAHALTWRLLGVAPGYVGHVPGCKDGLLVRVRDFPESILLLDEFEKADNAVGKVLLRVLDEGKAQDSEGNELDFRRCFVILTTNAGVSLQQIRRQAGFGGMVAPKEAEEDIPIPIVTRHDLEQDLQGSGLGPEFLARIHQMIFFQAVPRTAIVEIIGDELKAIKDQAAARKLSFEWAPEVPARLAGLWNAEKGVRYAHKLVRDNITEQLSIAAFEGELDKVQLIRIELLDRGGTEVQRQSKDGKLLIRLPIA
jgi:ATP-dependent Clp protease ATP-binding subunit ClpA